MARYASVYGVRVFRSWRVGVVSVEMDYTHVRNNCTECAHKHAE